MEIFQYLRTIISVDGSLDKEITTRIQEAKKALGRLGTRVLQQKGIRLSTKLKIYKAIDISSLLYGCETWTPVSTAYKAAKTAPYKIAAHDPEHLLAGQGHKPGSAGQN